MKHSDFVIGKEFYCGYNKWRCTDVGRRTVCAIKIEEMIETVVSDGHGNKETTMRMATENDYAGPPYGVVEQVFDEYDFDVCYQK